MKVIIKCAAGFYILLFGLCGYFYAGPEVYSKTVTINAELGWQDTGVRLKYGQYYSVDARGSWVSGYDVGAHGPEGFGGGTIVNGALLGCIDKKKPERLGYKSFTRKIVSSIIYIGRGGMLKSINNGTLWMAMGEWSGCKECRGKLEVLITVYDE